MARVFGYGGFLAVILTTFDYTGGKLSGWRKPHEMDEYDRKEYLRKNRRRPIEETLADCGEGRGESMSPGLCGCRSAGGRTNQQCQ